MFTSAPLNALSGACAACQTVISVPSVPLGTSLNAVQGAVLQHIQQAHATLFANLPVVSLGLLVASSASSFGPVDSNAL
jgi:ABC-type tungstate transport system substrate-binding protein